MVLDSNKRDFIKTFGAASLGGATVAVLNTSGGKSESSDNPVYKRVVETRTLRCAYASYPPMFSVDPNSKKMSGIFYDLINEMGRRLGLKVRWAEEVGYGNINEGFITGRYDIFAAGLFVSSARATTTMFSDALLYSAATVFVRHDDNRFVGQIEKLNDPAYTIVITDGDMTEAIAKSQVPLAKTISLPQNQSFLEEITYLVNNKVDARFGDLLTLHSYTQKNPGKIKDASPGKPIRKFPVVMGLPSEEPMLKEMLDAVIYEIRDDGTIRRTVESYLGIDQKVLLLSD
jgi:L-cystine transport system substrate-binding protein